MDIERFDKFIDEHYGPILKNQEEAEIERREILGRLRELERRHDNGMEWSGPERRQDAVFSDEQVHAIKEIFDERAEVHAGRLAFRAVLWTIGSLAAGAATAALAFLGLKH